MNLEKPIRNDTSTSVSEVVWEGVILYRDCVVLRVYSTLGLRACIFSLPLLVTDPCFYVGILETSKQSAFEIPPSSFTKLLLGDTESGCPLLLPLLVDTSAVWAGLRHMAPVCQPRCSFASPAWVLCSAQGVTLMTFVILIITDLFVHEPGAA